MLQLIRRNAQTIVVAMVTAAVTAGGPALAHGVQHALFAHNADKVDGKHAVGAGATADQRKRKLVATDGSGALPNDIISKALDSDLLDGQDSSAFLGVGAKAADSDRLDGQDSSAFVTPAKIYKVFGNYTSGVADGRTGGRKAELSCDSGDMALDGGFYTGSVNNPNHLMGQNTYYGGTYMLEWWVPGGGSGGSYALVVTCLDSASPPHAPGRGAAPRALPTVRN
jgi:hypothetical protein